MNANDSSLVTLGGMKYVDFGRIVWEKYTINALVGE